MLAAHGCRTMPRFAERVVSPFDRLCPKTKECIRGSETGAKTANFSQTFFFLLAKICTGTLLA